jgi:CHAD domain-containing protein
MSVYQKNIHNLFVRTARQVSKTAAKAEPRNVHQLRTSIRRVEAVLEEVSPELDGNQRKLLKILGRLRRRAGRVRDIDVHIAALRGLKVSDEPGRKTQIISTFAALRATREKKLLKMFTQVSVREIRKRLKRAEHDLHLPADFPGPLALASRNFAAVTDGNKPLNEETLHQYRIRGKRARYVAELARQDPQAEAFVSRLKHMQDVLGEWHDWLTLAREVAKIVNGANNSPLVSALNNISRAKFHDAIQVVEETRTALLAGSSQRRKQPSSASHDGRPRSARAIATAVA